MNEIDIEKIQKLMEEADQAKAEGNREAFAFAIAQIFRELPEQEVLDIMRTALGAE